MGEDTVFELSTRLLSGRMNNLSNRTSHTDEKS
jgi:hypothetical protein